VADGSTVPAHVREAVHRVAARVPAAVVSGAARAEIEPVLEASGLASDIRVVVAAEDVDHGKPHPEGYLRALASLDRGLAAHDVLVFEDTEAGVAAAKAAGMRCVGVLGTLAPGRLAAADELAERLDATLVERLVG
jgi:HAD superfamily hydrolase (TIGR01509 family)